MRHQILFILLTIGIIFVGLINYNCNRDKPLSTNPPVTPIPAEEGEITIPEVTTNYFLIYYKGLRNGLEMAWDSGAGTGIGTLSETADSIHWQITGANGGWAALYIMYHLTIFLWAAEIM